MRLASLLGWEVERTRDGYVFTSLPAPDHSTKNVEISPPEFGGSIEIDPVTSAYLVTVIGVPRVFDARTLLELSRQTEGEDTETKSTESPEVREEAEPTLASVPAPEAKSETEPADSILTKSDRFVAERLGVRTTGEIALEKGNFSSSAIRTQLTNIFSKFGVASTIGLLGRLVEEGHISMDRPDVLRLDMKLLTTLEKKCLSLLGAGYHVTAEELSISHSTVSTHLHNIYSKMGIPDGLQLAAAALKAGELSPEDLVRNSKLKEEEKERRLKAKEEEKKRRLKAAKP